ncbi:hypothetical protein TNCV_240441 [Trichonephila clavipes]|nr:hypothetical protein TNCV_240441 [Trichonephila clavipes]
MSTPIALYWAMEHWQWTIKVAAATSTGYQDLSEFERVVIVGEREMGHNIYEVVMKFGFSHTTISRVYLEYGESAKHQIYDIDATGKR